MKYVEDGGSLFFCVYFFFLVLYSLFFFIQSWTTIPISFTSKTPISLPLYSKP